MFLTYDIRYLRHLKRIDDFWHITYEYDLPIQFQTYKTSLLAINTNSVSRKEILLDYSKVINDAIKNNRRPAIIVRKLEDLSYRSTTKPNIIQYKCREITVKRAQEIIDANIAAISNLNQYFNDYILISQIQSTL